MRRPSGEPGAQNRDMLKCIFLLRRRPELSIEQFRAHWQERHAPLVRAHAKVLGVWRYVQTLELDDRAVQAGAMAARGCPPADFDGCAELWWESLESYGRMRTNPEALSALRLLVEDERCFIDMERSLIWYGLETTIVDETGAS